MKQQKEHWVKTLFSFAGPCKGKMTLSVLCAILSVAGGFVPFWAVYEILLLFINRTATLNNIMLWCLVGVGGYLIRVICFGISTILAHISAYTILEGIRLKIANRLMRAPLGEVMGRRIGYLKNIIMDKVEDLEPPLAHMIPELTSNLLLPVAIFIWLLAIDWRKLGHYDLRQDWKSILLYAVVVFALTQGLYALTALLFGESGGIHIEVLLPAFVLGMTMRHRHVDSAAEARASSFVSFLFMFLVGVSMPLFIGVQHAEALSGHHSVTGSQPMMSWGTIAVHVLIVSLLSNLGKLFPVFFYRDRKLSERLALSIGMFTRGEVGAGVIFIALGYNLGGPVLIVSVLTIVLNLILTGGFVLLVKRLALKAYGTQPS